MKLTRRRLVAGACVIVALFGPGVFQWLRLSWHERVLDRRLRALEATHQQLSDEQQRLASDPVYEEGLIRSTFKMAKPGELVVTRSEKPTKPRR
jgi:hypothetical protein